MRMARIASVSHRRRKLLLLGANGASALTSTLTADTFVPDVSAVGTVAISGLVANAAGTGMSEKQPALSTNIERVSSTLTLGSADAATIEATSGEAIVTYYILDRDGNAVVGVPAAFASLASTGTGNTITALDTHSNRQGRFRWTFSSTVAEAKTLTLTACGRVITGTVAVTVSGGGATLLIDAQWPDLGTDNADIASSAQFDTLIDGNPVSATVMGVVTGVTGSPTTNALQMSCDSTNYSLIQEIGALSAVTDWYCRVYIMVENLENGFTNHPYKTDWRGSNSIILWSPRDLNFGAGTYRPAIRMLGTKWVDGEFSEPGDIDFKCPALDYGEWYRFEHRVTFVGDPTLGRFYPQVRVYNAANTLLYTNADFEHTLSVSPFTTHDLQTSIDGGAYYQAANVDGYLAGCGRQPAMGYEGPFGAPTEPTEHYYYAAYAAGTGTWLGAV